MAGPVLPTEPTVVRDQLVVYSDFNLPRKHRVLEELVALRGDIAEKLDISVSDEPIHVYLFDEAKGYRDYIDEHYPKLPERRAFFVESDTRLAVYAHWSDRVAEDLRHEVAHGYLHAVTPNVPLWLDEGIAEYFEVPRGRNGRHRAHVEMLAGLAGSGQWRPDLERLERLASIDQMTQRDYAESWLWVHLLLETSRERRVLLQNHLNSLRQTGQAPPLSRAIRQIAPQPEDELLRHLQELL